MGVDSLNSRSIFVTGTDTDVGKTAVCSWIVHHWNAQYWKPVQSGLADGTDSMTVQRLANIESDRIFPEIYRLQEPLSPHAAAAIDGVEIQMEKFQLPAVPDGSRLVVEGAGGILVPLNDSQLVLDLIEQLALPILVVARSGLGTLNHTLMTLATLRSRDLKIGGVIMVGPENESNRVAIQHYGQTRVLAELPIFRPLNHQALAQFPLSKNLIQFLDKIAPTESRP